MDIGEDYYYQCKNTKQRKYEGTSKRKGNTIRNFTWACGSKGERTNQEVVTKTVTPKDDWNTDKINYYCRTVLRDGGMRSNVKDHRNCDDEPANVCKKNLYNPIQTPSSMKKRKRWELPNEMVEIIKSLKECNANEGPDIILVDNSIGPRGRSVNRKVRGTKKQIGGKSVKVISKPKLTTKKGKNIFPNSTDLLNSLPTDERKKLKKSSRNARPKVKIQRPEVMYEFAWGESRDNFSADNRKFGLSQVKKDQRFPANAGFRMKPESHEKKRQSAKENKTKLQTWDINEQWLDEECHQPEHEDENAVENRSSSRILVPIEDFMSMKNRRQNKRSKKQVLRDRLTKVSLDEYFEGSVNENYIALPKTCCDWPDSDDDEEEDGFVLI